MYCGVAFPADALPQQPGGKKQEPEQTYHVIIQPPARVSPAILEAFCQKTNWDTAAAQAALSGKEPIDISLKEKEAGLALFRDLMNIGLECRLLRPQISKPLPLPEPVAFIEQRVEQLKPAERPEEYHIILGRPDKLERKQFDFLALLTSTDGYIITQRCKSGVPWSVKVFDHPDEAQAFQTDLEQAGIEAYVIKSSGLQKLAHKIEAAGMKGFFEKGIVFLSQARDEVEARYDDLFLIVKGRIQMQPEPEEEMLKEEVFKSPGSEQSKEGEEPEDPLARIVLQARQFGSRAVKQDFWSAPGKQRMTIKLQDVEVADIYLKSSHHAIRIIEDQFDYSGMSQWQSNSVLINFQNILNNLIDHAPELSVDDNFKRTSYTLERREALDKARTGFITQGPNPGPAASKKLYDNKAAFTDYSSRLYLHHLRLAKTRNKM